MRARRLLERGDEAEIRLSGGRTLVVEVAEDGSEVIVYSGNSIFARLNPSEQWWSAEQE